MRAATTRRFADGAAPVPIPYIPRRWAEPVHQSYRRFACLVLHRRAGKTTCTLVQHQRAATDDKWELGRLRYQAAQRGITLTGDHLHDLMKHRVYGHVLPTRVQAKLAAWDMLKDIASHVGRHKVNESELRIDYSGGHRVQLFGGDEPDKLRGPGFSGLSFDEYGLHRPNIFTEVMSKNLADHLGYAWFLGTIKGKNQLWRTYEAAKNDPDWFALWQDINQSLATESDATILMLRQAMHDDQQWIAKGLMSQEEYDQEWFLSVEAAIKGAYYGKHIAEARRQKRIGRVPYDPAVPVHDVWDLGAGENLSVGLFQRIAREVHMIEYLEGAESDGINAMIATLQRRPYVFGKHLAPHDIKAKELTTGKTREETAKALGWPFTIVPDIGVDDGINAGRMLWARLWVDEDKCAPFLEAIPMYRRQWFERLGMFGPDPVHDHASHPADMFRYAAVGEHLMTSERSRPPARGAGQPARGAQGPNAGLAWMG